MPSYEYVFAYGFAPCFVSSLNIPRLFAALVLITLAGVAFYSVALLLSHLALGHWHESELGRH